MTHRASRVLALAAGVAVGLVNAGGAVAAVKTYIGPAGTSSWSIATNWSPLGAPQTGDIAFLEPNDASNRTVIFNGTGGSAQLDTVLIAPFGSGSLVLQNALANGGPNASILNVSARGEFRQLQTGSSHFASVVLGGGTISGSAGTTLDADDIEHTGGQLGGGGTFIVSHSYFLDGGFISNANIVNNGTFTHGAGGASGGVLINNGTLDFVNGTGSLNTELQNHGTLQFNSDARILRFDNHAPVFLPPGRTLQMSSSGFSMTLSDGTFTQFGTVIADNFRIRGGIWDQRGGFLSANASPSQFLVGADGVAGSLNISDGTAFFAGTLSVGPANSTGTMLQSGGTITASLAPIIGAGAGGRGLYRIDGGRITAGGLVVGAAGAAAATFEQNGGAVSIGTLLLNENGTTPATITIGGGSFQVNSTATNNGAINQSGGAANFVQGVRGSGTINLSGAASMRSAQTSVVRNVTFDETSNTVHGQWDLTDGALVVDYGGFQPMSNIRRYIRSGYASGAWTGQGLRSSTAAASPLHNTALGAVESSDIFGATGGTFEGVTVDSTAVLVKYTYFGDTDLNGTINFDDYVRTDNGFNNHLTGWFNGDFDYNNAVNFDDYVLIDLAFNTQSGTLRRAMAFLDGSDRTGQGMSSPALSKVVEHFGEFGAAYAEHLLAAVPEPASLGVAVVGLMGALAARRRRASRR